MVNGDCKAFGNRSDAGVLVAEDWPENRIQIGAVPCYRLRSTRGAGNALPTATPMYQHGWVMREAAVRGADSQFFIVQCAVALTALDRRARIGEWVAVQMPVRFWYDDSVLSGLAGLATTYPAAFRQLRLEVEHAHYSVERERIDGLLTSIAPNGFSLALRLGSRPMSIRDSEAVGLRALTCSSTRVRSLTVTADGRDELRFLGQIARAADLDFVAYDLRDCSTLNVAASLGLTHVGGTLSNRGSRRRSSQDVENRRYAEVCSERSPRAISSLPQNSPEIA